MTIRNALSRDTATRRRLSPARSWSVALIMVLGACAADDSLVQIERSAEELYNIAMDEATTGEIKLAPEKFDEVERQHPYSKWATRAQLMSAWALYQSNNYAAAIPALDRCIELNPAHEDVDYAFYLKAMSYYEQIVDVERDAGMTLKAREAFEALLKRFPDSEYSRDGQLKYDLTNSHLAGKEMAVGRFYVKREHYAAAIRRFSTVVRDYDTSNQVPEALYRIVEAYLALGIDEEATRAGAVLKYNYPDSIWTARMLRLIDDPETNHEPALFEQFLDRAINLF
ncbi:MAG: outer membrane protein assembly factor BamD [Alphaproteobacteria bacterium]|nr:outer membrane protein assembly factor BamD [Alphaproteobacteria bacterium]